MAKHKITVTDKNKIRDIIFKTIEQQNPIFDYKKYIDDHVDIITEYIQNWVDNCLELSPDVKTFIKTYDLAKSNGYGYGSLIADHDFEGRDNYITKSFCLYIKTMWELRYKAPKYKPIKYVKVLENKNTIADCIYAIVKEEGETLNIEIQKREREFMKIYSNFKNILYSVKYLEDLANLIPLPEVVKYVEEKLLAQCTTLAPINQESINFVDNYIKTIKKS